MAYLLRQERIAATGNRNGAVASIDDLHMYGGGVAPRWFLPITPGVQF
jgi:hypothetical protein